MNRLLIVFLLLVLPIGMYAQTSDSETEGVKKAKLMLEYLQKGEGEKAYQMMDAVMQNNLTAEKTAQIWTELSQQCGKLNEQGPYREEAQEGNQVIISDLSFDNITLQYVVVLNPEGKVCGLWFKPATA